ARDQRQGHQAAEDLEGMSPHATDLHRDAVIWDTHGGFSPFADLDLSFLERWLASGVTYLSVNVGYDHVITWQDTVRAMAHFRRWIALHPRNFVLAETTADIARAKRDGKLAIAFDLEGTDALDGNIEMIALYYRLGVRQMLFAYNRTNRFAGGCHDEDIGLTPLGREALAEMNLAPPELLPEITELLVARGYSDSDVRGILGENFLRVARQVWQ